MYIERELIEAALEEVGAKREQLISGGIGFGDLFYIRLGSMNELVAFLVALAFRMARLPTDVENARAAFSKVYHEELVDGGAAVWFPGVELR